MATVNPIAGLPLLISSGLWCAVAFKVLAHKKLYRDDHTPVQGGAPGDIPGAVTRRSVILSLPPPGNPFSASTVLVPA